jgi:hypothetical protein
MSRVSWFFSAPALLAVTGALWQAGAAAAAPPLYLPWEAGKSHAVVQGPNSGDSHVDEERWGWDFDLAKDEAVLASAPGRVVATYDQCQPYVRADGCGAGHGNHVVVDHGDGSYGKYSHLATVSVRDGQDVAQAQQLGTTGNSGYSRDFHLHFQLQEGAGYSQSIESGFVEGAMKQGDVVTSQNRPGGSRLAAINGCSALFSKDGAATAEWVMQIGCADAQAVALGGNRIAAITGCGAMYLKDGPPTATWVKQIECGDAKAIATTQDRIAVVTACNALYTKDGAHTNAWTKQLECGDAQAVALNAGSASAVVGVGDRGGSGDRGGADATAERAVAASAVRAVTRRLRADRSRRLARRRSFLVRLVAPIAGELAVRVRADNRIVAHGRRTVARPGRRRIRLRATRRGRAVLRSGRRVRLTIEATFSRGDVSGGASGTMRLPRAKSPRRRTG